MEHRSETILSRKGPTRTIESNTWPQEPHHVPESLSVFRELTAPPHFLSPTNLHRIPASPAFMKMLKSTEDGLNITISSNVSSACASSTSVQIPPSCLPAGSQTPGCRGLGTHAAPSSGKGKASFSRGTEKCNKPGRFAARGTPHSRCL